MLRAERTHVQPIVQPVQTVPDGYLPDFLTRSHVKDTPEEYVRQNLERALVEQYGYPTEHCEPEFRIKVGSSPRRATDIAVFSAGAEHRQENVYIVVECKRADTNPADRKDGIDQLKSYLSACLNARYGLWTNGTERHCFAKRDIDGQQTFEEILDIPRFGKTEEQSERLTRRDLRPASADNLLFAFRRCHNYIAGSEGMHKTEAFWELLKIIFAKIEDERSSQIDFLTTSRERVNATAALSAKTRIQAIFNDKVADKYPQIFPQADREISLNPSTIAYVVSQLQGYSLLESSVDVKGVAYEEIVGANLRGDRGEFFTPRNACRMAVSMLDPQPGEILLDPACGTGGFLITAMNHALSKLAESERTQWADPESPTRGELEELYRKRAYYLGSMVFGLDLNPALVRAAKMNMVMNNDGAGGINQANSLANPNTWNDHARNSAQPGSVDVLFTNPPFGTRIVVDDTDILRQYELAAMWDRDETTGDWAIRRDPLGDVVLQKSQPPEILFIERCIQFLKPQTGRLAMVIPNGILNNPALGYVRTWMLQNVQILAVVDMQRDLFQPQNDTQTSMVLMRRLSEQERALAGEGRLDYPIFMAVAEKIGHDKRRNTIYRRSPDGDELLESVPSGSIDPITGLQMAAATTHLQRVVDDEIPEVSTAYLSWLRDRT